jgi:tetratricopeptide (TPR) repeat protein
MIIFNWLAVGIILISALIGYIFSLPLYLFHVSSGVVEMVAIGIAVIAATIIDAPQWSGGKKGGYIFFIPVYMWGILIIIGATIFGVFKLLVAIYTLVTSSMIISIVAGIALVLLILFLSVRAYIRHEVHFPRGKFSSLKLISILIVIVCVVYIASNYFAAHVAYSSVDCKTSISYYSRLDSLHILAISEYFSKQPSEYEECKAFQLAVEKQNAEDFSSAFVLYKNYYYEYYNSNLSPMAKKRIADLFEQVKPSMLTSRNSCNEIQMFITEELIIESNVNLPLFYFACGQMYDKSGDITDSFNIYNIFLQKYPKHQLGSDVKTALLTNSVACERYKDLQNFESLKDDGFMPSLYWICGQMYENKGNKENAMDIYMRLITEYPNDTHITKLKEFLITDIQSCRGYVSIENSSLDKDTDFISALFYKCGLEFEKNSDNSSAIAIYERFLSKYPNHNLTPKVEAALAKLLILKAKSTSAGNIPIPNVSGSTASGVTDVVIQNDSPDKLRIVFSGPQAHIETLEACSTCTNYYIAPLYCPEKGPIGRYSLPPGAYSVVVESIDSNGATTPWTGSWNLASGDEYYSCFLLITTIK